MLSKSIALFLFLVLLIIKKISTKDSSRNCSTGTPYLFTGITLCNGTRISGVELELQTKRRHCENHCCIYKNSTDEYGVFTLRTLVKNETEKGLKLYFRYNCNLKNRIRNPHKKVYSVNVSSLNCPRDSPTGGIKCELKAELQNNTVHSPSVSLFPNKTRKKYEIEKFDIKNNISFFISKNLGNFSRVEERIINVTKEIENKTCIIFQQRNDKISEGRGINFKKSNECKNTKIGMKQENSSQSIYLTEECATSTRTIRSLLHQALGQL
uniref:Astacin domain-containing protein n=1 Tax=Parastrongyloides trichosuri TaxID=131310 RepID=A0A0N4ZXQ3_PARTI